jgi:peptidoglycan/LPS O-acetylase OafA/YrhL
VAERRAGEADRFPCFDGLRAIAALSVVGVHTAFATGFSGRWRDSFGRYSSRLEIGVEVFFVISGFLLYRGFAAAHFTGRTAPRAGRFWIRRLKRIIPAYWTALLVITYVTHGNQDPGVHNPSTWDAPLIYLGFAQIYFPHYILHGLSQAWSLCTEMSFYLMVPLYAMAVGRRRRQPDEQFRVELIGLGVLVAVSLAFRIPVLEWNSNYAGVMTNWLPAYADQFALGMFLAVASSWMAATGRRPAWLWGRTMPYASWTLALLSFVAVSNLGLAWTPLSHESMHMALLRQTLYGAFAFFLVVPAVFGPQDRGLPRLALRFRPLALIGVVSYGVYLWHENWIVLYLRWVGEKRLFLIPWPYMLLSVAALAVASATASYLLVERPVLRWSPARRVIALRSEGRPSVGGADTSVPGAEMVGAGG